MPLPTGIKVEFEFTAGSWTDVTADVDWGTGWTINIGRTSPHQAPSVGTLTFTLRNPKGKFTPGVQTLSDGTTAPYYPNIKRRIRVRASNSAGVRFLGYVKTWSPLLVNGVAGYTQVTASDRLDLLGRVTMSKDIAADVLLDGPVLYYPLTDPVGTTAAVDASGQNTNTLTITGAGTALAFGSDGPGVEQGTGVRFNAGTTLASAPHLSAMTAATFECYAKLVNPVVGNSAFFGTDKFTLVQISGNATFTDTTGSFAGPAINDGRWHHLVGTVNAGTRKLYVDGVLQWTDTTSDVPNVSAITVGGNGFGLVNGWIGHVAIYNKELTAARILAHAQVAQQSGELVSDKVKRFLTYGGLTSSDWNVDTSTVVTGTYAQDGKDIVTACQDMATTEGGGSVLYVLAGVVQFRNRAARKPGAPTLTIDADKDLDNSAYQPSLDDQNLVNRVSVDRSTESGTQSTQVASNAASIAAEGLTASTVTSYARDDLDALTLAQQLVSEGSTPALRLPQITVNLTTAQNNLYAAVQATVIGSRIRVTAIPAGALPATQIDVLAEGWTETANIQQYKVVFDASPADSPARGIYDDTTYGTFQPQADCALNAAITNSATTVVIKSPTAPTFTTAAGMYPLKITVGAERIQLNSAPSGSTSPQTFTGVTRGVDGTTAAAQAINSRVTIWPRATYTL